MHALYCAHKHSRLKAGHLALTTLHLHVLARRLHMSCHHRLHPCQDVNQLAAEQASRQAESLADARAPSRRGGCVPVIEVVHVVPENGGHSHASDHDALVRVSLPRSRTHDRHACRTPLPLKYSTLRATHAASCQGYSLPEWPLWPIRKKKRAKPTIEHAVKTKPKTTEGLGLMHECIAQIKRADSSCALLYS